MGYSTYIGRNGAVVNHYYPDDNENTMYIKADQSWALSDIHAKIEDTWPGVSLENIRLSSVNIHTHYIGSGGYDLSDYTNFIVIHKET